MRIACTHNMRCSKPHRYSCTTQRSTTKTNLDRISFVEKSMYAHQIRINDLDLLVFVSSPYHFITLQFCCLFCCCHCCRRYFILFILLLFVVWTRAHKFPSDSSTLYTSSDLSQGSVKKCKLHGRRSQHTSLAQRQCIYNLYLFDCLICTFCFRQGHPKIRTTHLYGSAAYVIL